MKTYLTYNNITIECFPKNALKLSYKKNKDEVFLRRDLTESLIFVDDEVNNHFDYDVIMNQQMCTKFTFSIPDKNYTATFFITDCEVDEYKKTISVKPIVLDEYSPIYDVLDTKINLANYYNNGVDISIQNIGYDTLGFTQSYTPDLLNYATPTPPSQDEYLQDFDHYEIDDVKLKLHARLQRQEWTLRRSRRFGNILRWYKVNYYTAETAVVLQSEFVPSSDGWVFVCDIGSTLKKYVRRYGGNLLEIYTVERILGGVNDDFEEKDIYTLQYTPAASLMYSEVKTLPLLTMIQDYFIGNIQIESQFFDSEINPIASILGLTFSMKYLYVSVLSNFLFEFALGNGFKIATKAEITLQSLFDYLYEQFRVKWDMHNGKLRLEHELFYENGFSYTIPNIILKNICSYNNNYIYSFNKQSLSKSNSYEYQNSNKVTGEFAKHTITWDENEMVCFDSNNQVNETIISIFINDINWLKNNFDEARGLDAFILLHCNSDSKLVYTYSEYYNSVLPNGYLSILKCIKYFYTIVGNRKRAVSSRVRIYTRTYTNEKKTFEINVLKLKRIKIQKNININSSDFSTDYTYITPIGQGVVEEAEEDLDNGTVNLTLLYD